MIKLKVSELRHPVFLRINIVKIADKMDSQDYGKFTSLIQRVLSLNVVRADRDEMIKILNKIDNWTLVKIAEAVE